MRKLLLIVFLLLYGLANAQTPAFEFNMAKTYFCPGETIEFVYRTNIDLGSHTVTEFTIRGPLRSDGTALPNTSNVIPSGIPPSYIIPSCAVAHSGWYEIRARIDNGNPESIDMIEIHVHPDVIVNASATPFYVSPGGISTLHASGADYYIWSPATYLDDTIGENVHATIPVNIGDDVECIPFTVTGYVHGDNRVVNGDFEGSEPFTTQYILDNPGPQGLWYGGHYAVNNNSELYHYWDWHTQSPGQPTFHNPYNHNTPGCGSGNYMMINGDNVNQNNPLIVWSQVIRVLPNVDYAFSLQVSSFNDANRARLQFKINDVEIVENEGYLGEVFQAPTHAEGWKTCYALWTSGPNDTTATITIVNRADLTYNPGGGDNGCDFAIDNITFYDLMSCEGQTTTQVCILRDVTVGNINAPARVCAGNLLTLPQVPQVTINHDPCNHTVTQGWMIAPSPSSPQESWQSINANNPMLAAWNGWYLFYVVEHDGTTYTSNKVRITVVPPLEVEIDVYPNDSICPGETVTLTAVPPAVLHYVSPGDILCTDGTTVVKPSEWAAAYAQGKRAKGIVFYYDDTQSVGWAVSLNYSNNGIPLQWSTSTQNVPVVATHPDWRDAIRDFNGFGNTQTIRNCTGSNATTYPAAHAVDFANGWYLPAAGQLNMLFGALVEVNNSIDVVNAAAAGTATKIVDDNPGTTRPGGSRLLWSSTEGSQPSEAMVVEVADGWVGRVAKNTSENKYYVRAVITF